MRTDTWTGEQGDELTLVAACRDVLRVVSAAEGTGYDEDLAPVIEESDRDGSSRKRL